MTIWHDTDDAPRRPRRVSPTEAVELVIGTWPIAPGQSVRVEWEAQSAGGARTEGTTTAAWQHNSGVNSYWTARIGPFADGDRVTYTVRGSSSDGGGQTGPLVA